MCDQKVLKGTTNATKFGINGIKAGVSYAMSKRSDIYAIFSSSKLDNVANINDIKDM